MAVAGRVRVVAGSAGGLWLTVPKGFPSRPTQDRVKQAMFSMLGDLVPGARVLDLFAGTGSLGIEALSRGADSCVFVEWDRVAAEAIEKNLARCRLVGRVERKEVCGFVEGWTGPWFDLVLADPPYEREVGRLEEAAWFRGLGARVVPGGHLVWEHHRSARVGAADGWEAVTERRYGESAVTLLRRSALERI